MSIFVSVCWRLVEPRTPVEGSVTPFNTSTGARLYLLVRGGEPWQCSSLDQAGLETGTLFSLSLPPSLCSSSLFAFKLSAYVIFAGAVSRKGPLYSLQWGTCFPDCRHSQKKRGSWAVILWEAHIPPRLHFRTCRPAWLRVHCSMLDCCHGNTLRMGVGVWVTWSPKG